MDEPMNVLISGASGLVGSALKTHLESLGHRVYTLKRGRTTGSFYWNPDIEQIHLDEKIHLDAVVCLNGVNIGDQRWSPQRKKAIIESRVRSVSLLARDLAKRFNPPDVLICASAIGFYGDTGSELKSEQDGPGKNFLSEIVTQWEGAARPAMRRNIRTVFIRSGVVLSKESGALKKMLLPFKLGLGGRIGDGQQYMSWIDIEDEVRAIAFAITQNDLEGPVNLTAPHPVTNQEFTQTLGKTLNRPTPFPMPEWAVKLLFGEMGELLLLGSNRIDCAVLKERGFEFSYPDLESSLQHLIGT